MEKNNQTLTEEKIKKKFKSLNELIIIVLGFLIIAFITILFTLNPFVNNKENTDYGSLQVEESQFNDYIDIFQEKHPKTYSIFKYVITICSFTCMLSTFFVVGEICREIRNTGKPFSANTLKNINILTVIIIIWAIISFFNIFSDVKIGIGLIPACIICVLKYIFEYGYKLQIESDETL